MAGWLRTDLSNFYLRKKGIGFDNEEEKDGIEQAWLQYFELMKDPALGYVPSEQLLPVWQELQDHPTAKTIAAIPGITWTEHGPTNVGGRTRAIMIDPNDITGNTIWASGVNGGVWKCADITAPVPV